MNQTQRDQIISRSSDQDIDKAANAYAWICSLEETDLPQGRTRLGDKERGFCCLGLGCYVLGIKFQPSASWSSEFASSVGLKNKLGRPGGGSAADLRSLVYMNDAYHKTFAQIAAVMRKHPDAYFLPSVAKVLKVFLEEKL